jgi:segregation and condensation protein B
LNVQQIVEAVLFASDAPLTADEIARADEGLDEEQVEDAIRQLRAEYDDAARSFQLMELAEGHQILTRPEFAPYLERFDNVPRPSRLSGPALETLAIIAYRQPLGRLEMEYVRGVGVSGVVRTLQERNLIEVVGRAEGLGRPLLYGTTRHFLEHFGFQSLEDLPRPEELPIVLRERIPLGTDDDAEQAGEDEEQAGGVDVPELGDGSEQQLELVGEPVGEPAADAEPGEEEEPNEDAEGTPADAEPDRDTEDGPDEEEDPDEEPVEDAEDEPQERPV